MTQLLELPAELLALLVLHLDDVDFLALRLTSRYLESSTCTPFGKRFFRKKGYMLTTPSLKVLQAVANHEKFGKYVEHIWFNPDCYTYIDIACAPEEDLDCDDAENEDEESRVEVTQRVDLLSEDDRRKWDAYCECMEDYSGLVGRKSPAESLELRQRLTDVFSCLPNLKIIGMRRSEDHKPWGWRTLTEQVGEDPRIIGSLKYGTNTIPATNVFHLGPPAAPTALYVSILGAVAASGTKLKRFYTDAIEVDRLGNWEVNQKLLNKALGSILYLELNVNSGHRSQAVEAYRGDCLVRTLEAVAPTLLELGLQIMRPAVMGYEVVAFEKVVRNVQFERLTRVKLENIAASSKTLTAFLEPCKAHLTSLKLKDVKMLAQYPEGGNPTDRPWGRLFSFLSSECTKLAYLLVYNPRHDTGGVMFVEESVRSTRDWQARNIGRGGGAFVKYEDISLEVDGREKVARTVERLVTQHWYVGSVYSYAMDNDAWHTDTSDEEW